MGWYIEQQRERARLVWRDYDPSTVPPDYQSYYARDQHLASGPHPGEPTPEAVRLRDLQSILQAHEIMIEYVLGQDRSFALEIGPQRLAAYRALMATVFTDFHLFAHLYGIDLRDGVEAAAHHIEIQSAFLGHLDSGPDALSQKRWDRNSALLDVQHHRAT